MKEAYRTQRFRGESIERIDQANEILDEYDQKLTARQLYYQFVARGLIPNTPTSYKNLTGLLADARYAGLVDWHKIEDRGREPDVPSEWSNLSSLVDSALRGYRLPRWEGQECYAELWVEKQALAGVLAPLARKHHVTLMVNKGYSSASAMYDSAQRFRENCVDNLGVLEERESEIESDYRRYDDKNRVHDEMEEQLRHEMTRKPVLFYLGDHDPSGEDMVRDIRDRLREFRVWGIEVVKLGLTIEQVRKFKPPPNPAKITDSRAKAYIEKFGEHSWEVDALPPRELNRIIDAAFTAIIDRKKMDAVVKRENEDKERLKEAVIELRRNDE